MATVDTGSKARRQMVHTENRSPIETVIGRIVTYVFGVIEVLLALRFVLLLTGANRSAGFVGLIYNLSAPFMAPFNAVFKTQTAAGSTFEWSALVAIAIYALIAWGVVALISAISPRRSAQTVERVEQSENATTDERQ